MAINLCMISLIINSSESANVFAIWPLGLECESRDLLFTDDLVSISDNVHLF